MERIDQWYALYAPHMKQILWDYQVKGSHAHKYFPSLVPLNDMLKKGQAELWNPYTKTSEILTWQPYQIPNWRHEPLRHEIGDRYAVWLVQPFFESKDPVWKWRVSVWDKRDPSGLHYEVELTETQIDRVLEKPGEAEVYLETKHSDHSGSATPAIDHKLERKITGLRSELETLRDEVYNKHRGVTLSDWVTSPESPGIVINEERAKASPCKCFTYKGKDYCYSPGIIGMLEAGQVPTYCPTKEYEVRPGIKQRFEEFAEAAEAAHERIEEIPKGERLVPWLTEMGKELRARGIEV